MTENIDGAMLAEARQLGIRRQQTWLRENRGALDDANEFVKAHGLWSDGLRQF